MPANALQGRVALVTGASRRIGIGAAIVRNLAAQGARVVIHSWAPHDAGQPWGADPDGPQALVDQIRAAGGEAVHVAANLAEPQAPAALVAASVDAFGRLDVLVANHARSSDQSLEDLTAAELDLSYAVNTRATLLLVQELAARHAGAPGGRVVLFTSGQYYNGMPGELPYVASKGALHQLTRSLARHLAGRAITVNCIDPGPTDTGWANETVHRAVEGRMPMGRWGTGADAARLVGWLAGDDAAWVTGQVIASDGGWSSAGW